jgi:hypothetical protein
MEDVARKRGYDLTTRQGRRAALDDVYAEHPHLVPRNYGRPGYGHPPMPVATSRLSSSGYTLRRGQPPVGEPVEPPTNVAAPVRPFKPVPHSEQSSRWTDERNSGSGGVGGNLY